MSVWNIMVPAGESRQLLTAGKYCDRNIRVTAGAGGGGDAKTYRIELNVFEATFSLWFGDGVGMTNMTPGDHPPYIEVVGEQCIVVFVNGSAGCTNATGCASNIKDIWSDTDWGYMSIVAVGGENTEGALEIYGY